MMSSKKKEFSYIEAVDKVPPSKKAAKVSAYDNIIHEFLESGLKIAKIKPMEGTKPKSMLQSLSKRISGKHPITIRVRDSTIYLERKIER
jgi:hypothetical protein